MAAGAFVFANGIAAGGAGGEEDQWCLGGTCDSHEWNIEGAGTAVCDADPDGGTVTIDITLGGNTGGLTFGISSGNLITSVDLSGHGFPANTLAAGVVVGDGDTCSGSVAFAI